MPGGGSRRRRDASWNIGPVVDVNFGAGAAPLLIVNNESGQGVHDSLRGELHKKLDLKGKRIEMQLPEGMLELDAPLSAGKKDRQPKP